MPVAGILGDQQAALFGQTCFARGEAKNTYGTGSFLLRQHRRGDRALAEQLLTSVASKSATGPPRYVLEGSIAVTGAAVQWLRDQLGLIGSARRGRGAGARASPTTAASTSCPPSPGLFAPHWRDDARGVIVGLTAYARAGHIARAALEATAWQTREVLDAANAVDRGPPDASCASTAA